MAVTRVISGIFVATLFRDIGRSNKDMGKSEKVRGTKKSHIERGVIPTGLLF